MSLPHERTARPDGSAPGTLSTHRSFVIRLYAESDPPGGLAGRIEHVVSGQGSEFGSIDELLAFIHSVLHGCDPQPAPEQR